MPCCERVGFKKGPWKPKEDQKLLAYVERHGPGNWHSIPAKAGLQRCGKSCRLRWTNYLMPDIIRGNFSWEETRTIIQLHALVGNKWSLIAAHLPRRTDNDINNYWNANIKKKLIRMGIDPITHKPIKSNMYGDGHDQFLDTINMRSHMVQWESVRVEAEARGSMLQSFSSSDSLATKHNTDCDLQSQPVFTLSLPGIKNPAVCTNVGQISDPKDGGSNFQDDELMIAVEAFSVARCEFIRELIDSSTAMEGLINDSFERDA